MVLMAVRPTDEKGYFVRHAKDDLSGVKMW
jgi:hypothetical protein